MRTAKRWAFALAVLGLVLMLRGLGFAAQRTFTASFTDPPFSDGSPGSGIVKVEWTFNGVAEPALTISSVPSWTGTLTKTLKDGKNVVSIKVWDAQGNIGTASLEVINDASPPTGTITASTP